MDEKELEQAVKKLLVEACSSRRVLEPGIDLLESGLLDSLGLITLLDGLEDMGIEIQPNQVDRSCFRSIEGILQLCRTAKESPEATYCAGESPLAKPSFVFSFPGQHSRKNIFTKSDKVKKLPQKGQLFCCQNIF